jgi:hypothetical protein
MPRDAIEQTKLAAKRYETNEIFVSFNESKPTYIYTSILRATVSILTPKYLLILMVSG